jgi:hypothetical protein
MGCLTKDADAREVCDAIAAELAVRALSRAHL